MAKPLTAPAVSKFRPETQRREIPDGGCPGLSLIIMPSGVKSWAFRYRRPLSGKSAKLILGRYIDCAQNSSTPVLGDFLTLASARLLATRLRHEVAIGQDPSGIKARERDEDFLAAALDYVEHTKKTTRRWQQTAALLGLRPDGSVIKGALVDGWRNSAVSEIDEDAIFHVVESAKARSLSRGRVLFAALSSFFGWLKEQRRIKHNPVQGLKRPPASKPRERVLSDDEIRRFWRASGLLSPLYASVLRLLLLTGARLREISELRKAEVAADGSLISLPGSRTKNHRAHDIPLSPMAKELLAPFLDSQHPSEFVFTTTLETPISGWSKVKKRLDVLMGPTQQPWRIHDLRRTAVTGMARSGVNLPVIERAVNHVSGSFGGVVSPYQRHKYADEVKAAMDSWDGILTIILNSETSGNVIELKKSA